LNAEGGTGFAGRTDWRLPTSAGDSPFLTGQPGELESIVDADYLPAINPIFGPTGSDRYWSSSTFSDYPFNAWNVYFDYGSVDYDYKYDGHYVRAVRGGPPPPSDGTTCDDGNPSSPTDVYSGGACVRCVVDPSASPRYVDNGDGTITDRATCLVWEKKTGTVGTRVTCTTSSGCPDPHDVNNLYRWSDTGTDPDGSAFTLFLEQLNAGAGFAGRTDWRLPTSAGVGSAPTGQPGELESIVDTGYSPTINPIFGPTASSSYWSSSTYSDYPSGAWFVYFAGRYVDTNTKTISDFVRAVRGGVDLCAGVICTGGDQCNDAGTCNPATGVCSATTPKADGTACNDGNPATTTDVCTNGACGGVNLCAGVPDGTTCDDGNASTPTDICTGGTCGRCVPAGLCSTTTTAACAWDQNCPTGETCTFAALPDPRYVDNDDGTITDRKTCLVWEKKNGADGTPGYGTPDAANLHDVDNLYSWCDATGNRDGVCAGSTGNWIADLNAEGGTGFAGRTDWRLPTSAGDSSVPTGQPGELESIVDLGYFPAINPIFEPTASDSYWSSSTPSDDPDYAWFVYFSDGYVVIDGKNDVSYVRTVRGGP
jgi:hypothetical protein